jgi:hypothetical protein
MWEYTSLLEAITRYETCRKYDKQLMADVAKSTAIVSLERARKYLDAIEAQLTESEDVK